LNSIKFFFISFLFLFPEINSAQFADFGNDFIYGVDKGIELVSYPFNEPEEFLRNAGIAVGTAGILFLADKEIRKFSAKNNSSFNDSFFNVDKFYGSGYTVALSAVVYSAGLFGKSEQIRRAGLNSAVSIVYAGILTTTIKVLLGRHRPYLNDGNRSFSPFSFDNDNNSFPSGHTTVAFAFSTAMAESFDNTYWSIFWYSLAGMTAASRIYHDQHWLSDTFLGAAIGYGIGKFVSGGNENSKLKFSLTNSGFGFIYSLN